MITQTGTESELISKLTVEDLKREAKALGYNLVKIRPPMEKFLPCKCGNTSRSRWWGTHDYDTYIVECRKCGTRAQGRTERELRQQWNMMMRGEQE